MMRRSIRHSVNSRVPKAFGPTANFNSPARGKSRDNDSLIRCGGLKATQNCVEWI